MFIIPIEQDNPTRRRPVVVYALVAINLVTFLVTQYLLSWPDILAGYGFVPAAPTWSAALAALFLHAGWLHLLGNLFFFWMFADNVEDTLGPAGFLVAYLACGAAATGAHYLSDPASGVPLVGASGAISGMLGLYMVFFRYAHIDIAIYARYTRLAVFHLSALGAALAWLAEQTLFGLLGWLAGAEGPASVAFWAHVGGLLGGLLLGLVLRFAGLRAPAPARPLHFERAKAAKVWCPHCGRQEAGRAFGAFTCPDCGAEYEIAQEGGAG